MGRSKPFYDLQALPPYSVGLYTISVMCFSPSKSAFKKLIITSLLGSPPKRCLKPESDNGSMYLFIHSGIIQLIYVQLNLFFYVIIFIYIRNNMFNYYICVCCLRSVQINNVYCKPQFSLGYNCFLMVMSHQQ